MGDMANMTTLKKMIRPVLLACLTLLTVACGFHLQGEMHLAKPLQHLYLETSDPYGQLARDLRQYLKMSNVQLAQTQSEATAILNIAHDETSETLVSVGGTQQTRQYSLKVTVMFEITDKNGRTLVPMQTLSESRSITVQSNQVLGSSNEATLYYQQMRRRLAYAIMTRIASAEVTKLVTHAP